MEAVVKERFQKKKNKPDPDEDDEESDFFEDLPEEEDE